MVCRVGPVGIDDHVEHDNVQTVYFPGRSEDHIN